MKAQQLIGWMKDPSALGKEASAQLDTLTQTFPYFQSAHLLYIKSLHNENSFLYNNQLKVAAVYSTNRKILYELITKKGTGDKGRGTGHGGLVTGEKIVEKEIISEKIETVKEESKEIIQPEFPKKRFVKDEDEWESGMIRQLQLLHHWKTSPQEILDKRLEEIKAEKEKSKQAEKEKTPSAADEINTLLYVLVEPEAAEDISDSEEVVSLEQESVSIDGNENWEVNIVGTEPTEQTNAKNENLHIPEDAVSQEIIREAISSSIELEVDDTLPSLEELGHKKVLVDKQPETVKIAEPIQEEKTTSELTFASWIQELNKTATPEEVTDKEPVENNLVNKFIQDQPRIQQNKTSFFNPVNMAKKSVQDSDEFITETLAKIYVKQGNISKGIRAYQKLSLKFPEKSAYFAALIEELKRTPK